MHTSDDPLDAVLRPPPDETPEQAAVREAREAEARRVSAAIDADIKAERQARRKKRIVRLLLLGQSESGKSTTLRQFQRLYTPTAFREERILWRAVIQLNVVRSIRTILEALEPTNSYSPSSRAPSRPRTRRPSAASASMLALAASPTSPYPSTAHAGPSSPSYHGADPYDAGYDSAGGYASPGVDSDVESDPGGADFGGTSVPVFRNGVGDYGAGPSGALAYHHQLQQQAQAQSQSRFANAPPPIPNGFRSSSPPGANGFPGGSSNTITLDALKLALLPLRHVEALLIARLVPTAAGEEEPAYLPGSTLASTSTGEIFVRPGGRWKGAGRRRTRSPSPSPSPSSTNPSNSSSSSPGDADIQPTLHACFPAMHALWADPGVREVLRRRKVRVEEGPGFFLDDLERVTGPNYLPTDDDVLRARLKTVGVSEYTFEMEVSMGRETGTEWRIVDVGGSRTTWVPFFDDVDAIIFLAPIAGFDQVLAEDKTVNRLEDSVLLWKAVCSNKLLAGVDLVLFLNKCDILEKKLEGGVRLVRYVRSYADRENTFEAVSQYLRSKFSAIHREYSPNPRKFYAFLTSVTDTATTGGIIASVRDMVVRQHLKQSKLL
ncbi:guanine nucleotide binding protein, alpha subunit [Mycena alexandri]|uniref:Guanine nucleotide binding protein, alpha subunit n=1 Tax=Mycena alexandri TaxID=1745969 RepID=A0AAD6SXD1_9AGAR|nr:guanine nucleotide binding protein, alpha subunit [Mycena alexandri]